MGANAWWLSDPNERFWLELSDRDEIGLDLRAPSKDGGGHDNWRYSLFTLAAVGDVVYHYHTPTDAIVGVSVVAAAPYSEDIMWGARGTFARAKGEVPHLRAGYRIPLRSFQTLANPLTLEKLRESRADLERVVAGTKKHFGGTLYFPFELGKRPVRPLQGYAFKLPASFVTQLLDPDVTAPPLFSNEALSVTPSAKVGQGHVTSGEHREVVERHAMQHAETYFRAKGYTIKDVHGTCSYDLQAERKAEVLHVEVKGSTGKKGPVLLTRNEVDLARAYPGRAVLYVLHSIKLTRKAEGLAASGGSPVVFKPWAVDSGTLEPTQFRYSLPVASSGTKRR